MRGLNIAVGALVVLVLGVCRPAFAGRGKVAIETDPPGATVYLESTETTPVCEKTPCTIDMPAQESVLYIQLKNYQVLIEEIDPAKKPTKIKRTLEPATGGIVVKDAKGSHVQIDDEDKGKAPDRFEVGEGPHHLVITGADGKSLLDQFVEVKLGEDTVVEVGVGGGGDTGGTGSGSGDDPNHPDKDDPNAGKITKPGPSAPHEHYLRVSLATDIGFRSFTYANNTTMNTLREVSEGGEVLVGPMVELWPMEIIGLPKARGLSLMARVQFHVNHQAVDNPDTMSLTTFWQNIEVLGRYRWVVADAVGIEALAGYGSEAFRFNGLENEIALVPDAQYQSVKFGARVSATGLVDGKVEPFLEGENRIVVSGGALSDRFSGGSSVSGLHGAIGIAVHAGPIFGRVEGAITRYSWDFKSNNASDTRIATGGTDQITQVAVDVGYQY